MKQVNLRICRTILPLLLGLFLSVGVYAQNITVKGHVKDALGGVIGANVIEKGNPSNGTITDVDGNFTLSVPKGAILQVSFIGYKTQEIEATSSVIVTLKDDSELLNEVVVRPQKEKYSKKENPAVKFVKQVIASRESNDPRNHDYFQYDQYEKMVFAMNDYHPKPKKNGKPGPSSLIMNSPISRPILRWSRFLASSMRVRYSSSSVLFGNAVP